MSKSCTEAILLFSEMSRLSLFPVVSNIGMQLKKTKTINTLCVLNIPGLWTFVTFTAVGWRTAAVCLTGTFFRKLLTLSGSAGGPLSLCRGARRRQRGRERRESRHFSTVNAFLINGSASASVSPYSPHIPDPPCKILSWRNSELLPESQVRVQVCGLTQRHGARPCRASMRRL